MDYGKSGAPKGSNHEPRNAYDNPHGAPKAYAGKGNDKAALLARMKANAEKAKKEAK